MKFGMKISIDIHILSNSTADIILKAAVDF